MKTTAVSLLYAFLTQAAFAAENCRPVEAKVAHFESSATSERKTLCRHGEKQWSEPGWEKSGLRAKGVDFRAGGFASPGLKICERLGGKPVAAKFSWEGEEIRSEFCSLKEGWVSLDRLEETYRNPKRRGR